MTIVQSCLKPVACTAYITQAGMQTHLRPGSGFVRLAYRYGKLSYPHVSSRFFFLPQEFSSRNIIGCRCDRIAIRICSPNKPVDRQSHRQMDSVTERTKTICPRSARDGGIKIIHYQYYKTKVAKLLRTSARDLSPRFEDRE